MFRFFRKIRLDNFSLSATRKYFLYGLGEIILVVIGILVALQINNWNDGRKQIRLELQTIQEIEHETEQNLLLLQNIRAQNEKILNDLLLIRHYITEDLPYSDTLGPAFKLIPNYAEPYFSRSAFNTLLARGLDIIRNKELRTKIGHMYENRLSEIKNNWEDAMKGFAVSTVLPFYAKHIQSAFYDRNLATPNDFEDLKNMDEFLNILSMMARLHRFGLDMFDDVELELSSLSRLIREELERRNH